LKIAKPLSKKSGLGKAVISTARQNGMTVIKNLTGQDIAFEHFISTREE
jgi:methionyl aminopeptidase